MTDTLNSPSTLDQAPITPDALMNLGLGFWGSKTFLSAVEIGIFTTLAAGDRTCEELAAAHDLHARSARDFLDALVALGVLDREGGRYANTAESDLFLDRNKPSYVGGLLEMGSVRMYGFWGSLTEALRTGEPQNESKAGGSLFDSIYGSPQALRGFLAGMSAASAGDAQVLAQTFPWERYSSVIDVGGAEGCVPVTLLQHHPHLTGGVFELPQVEPVFEEFATRAGVSDRLSFYAGDFFTDPLPSADVIVLGHILHDWGIDAKRTILSKAYDALPDGGAVVVYDAIIDDDRRHNAFGLLMSLNMLIETDAGFDYTGADCQQWLREAGFRTTYVQPLAGPDSMVVGIKELSE